MEEHPISDFQSIKGCVLILSNPMTDHLSPHAQHAEAMKRLWKDKIGCDLFEDKIHQDLDAKNMNEVFKRLANSDGSEYKYLVVIIISTGGLVPTCENAHEVMIAGNSREWLPEKTVFSYFHNDNSAWRGKSKLFVLAYNRFSEIEPGLLHDKAKKRIICDRDEDLKSTKKVDPNFCEGAYPRISDIVLVYGTSSSVLDETDAVFSEKWKKHGVLQMLTMVNKNVHDNIPSRQSVFESSLTSDFVLYPHPQHSSEPTETQMSTVNDFLLAHLSSLLLRNESFVGKTGREIMAEESIKIFMDALKLQSPDTTIRQLIESSLAMSRTPIATDLKKPLKGCVLIISTDLQQKSGDKLNKYDIDHEYNSHIKETEMMEKLWKDGLDCDVMSHIDDKHGSTTDVLKTFCEKGSQGYDYAVVIISGHGAILHYPTIRRPVFAGTAHEPVDEVEMLTFIADSSWRDKPKIFILDYCRGTRRDVRVKALPISATEVVYEDVDLLSLPPDVCPVIDNSFILYGTHSEYVARPNHLITVVRNVFGRYWDKKSVTEMLTLVNDDMKDWDGKGPIKSMSIFKSTMTKDLYLFQQ